MLGRDAHAGIADVEPEAAVAEPGTHGDAAVGGVGNGIFDEVAEYLAECGRIRVGRRRAGRNVGDEPKSLRGRRVARSGEDVAHHRGDVHASHVWPPTTALDPRQIEQVVHDTLHPSRVLANRLDEAPALVGRDPLVEQGLGEPDDGGKRRLELVAHVRHEVASDRLEPPEHGEVEHGQHRAAGRERPRCHGDGAIVHQGLRGRRDLSGEPALHCRAKGGLAGQQLARKGKGRRDVEQRARPLVDADHHTPLVECQHALLE